jgi:hypothetical protein
MFEEVTLESYNYDEFVPRKFTRWMRFEFSPSLGRKAPDFPLWRLDRSEVQLSEIWSQHAYTILEFGSFT